MPLGRRDFLGSLLASAPLTLGDLRVLLGRPRGRRRVDMQESLPESRVRCTVCPHNCVLEDGQTCFCRTRTNRGGILYTDAYANPCILRVDPIEKLPLHHYRPGSRALSLAVAGCNLRCQYCQNWAQAFKRPDQLRNLRFPVEDSAESLAKGGLDTLALAYTEPVAFLEYALDLSAALGDRGCRMVAASAAYANPAAMRKLARASAALVLALKGFREEFYKKACGVDLAPVLESIAAAKDSGTWIELTNLIVPTLNDSEPEARDLARWVVRNLGKDVPLHVARFVPRHRLRNLPRTPLGTLERIRDIAKAEGLRHVYLSNVAPHDGNNTYCAGCRSPLIRRMGFRIVANRLVKGRCPKCGKRLPGPLA